MPLPQDCSLSLLGYSRPGDTAHSKPKQAVIIRLSTEILDALESNPDAIKVDFNGSPVFWAGSAKFSMNAAKENLHHELYLRAASRARKNEPLKLHANVVGKFQVERKLDNGVRSRLRQSTKTLQEQRQERGIIQLESPPAQAASKALKKAGTLKSKAPLLRDHAQGVPREMVPRQIKKGLPLSRRRMIQLLAISDRTADEIVKHFGGPDCSPTYRSDVLDLLDQVSESSSSEANLGRKSSTMYRLKLNMWTDVRPATWDWSDEHERSVVSAKFEHALRRLGIPEADPMWKYSLRPTMRTTSSLSASTLTFGKSLVRGASGSSKAEGLAQRALVSVKGKRIKGAGRTDAGNGVFRDEMTQKEKMAVHKGVKGHEVASLPPAPKASAPLRKPPGSGFRSGRIASQATALAAAEDSGLSRRDFEGKPRDFTSLHTQSAISSASRPRDTNGSTPGTARSDIEADHLRPTTKRVQETSGRDEGITQKRRISSRDTDGNVDGGCAREPALKKRKTDRNAVDVSGLVQNENVQNENAPHSQSTKKMKKRLEPSGRHRLKDDSPATSQLLAGVTPVSNSLLLGNSSSSLDLNGKSAMSSRRRRSPIYTSSDEDAESTHTNKDFMPPQALPTDHASLRKRYNKSYGEYLTAFHELFTFRDKIDAILRNRDGNNGGFTSESDADLELIDPDELGRLCLRHKKLHDELESIQQVFSQSKGRVVA